MQGSGHLKRHGCSLSESACLEKVGWVFLFQRKFARSLFDLESKNDGKCDLPITEIWNFVKDKRSAKFSFIILLNFVDLLLASSLKLSMLSWENLDHGEL